MDASRKRLIYLLVFTGMLLIAGKLIFEKLFGFFEPSIPGISFQIRESPGLLSTSRLFALTLAAMPALVLLSWRLGGIRSSPDRKTSSLLIMLLFTVAAVWIRHKEVRTFFLVNLDSIIPPGKESVLYPIDPRNFVYYMLGGFFTGWLLTVIFLRPRKS
ncbi:MAG TPA: hypothetical protein VKR53_14420 [Puia sp.]|nr:hypothetical protein [Puia sp.]